jgi:N-acetylglutamate synthase-like GNAT family acetyltransferase
MNLEYQRDHLLISTDKAKLQLDNIQKALDQTYWAKGICKKNILKSIENSLSYGVYLDGMQIGFARVITDYSTFAYLSDVYILNSYQNQGIASWLMECILTHPDLQNLRRFLLLTKDAHELYKKFGFKEPENPEEILEKK